jgi:ribosomal protein S18 acetylase RimI-like enzyme
MELLLRQAETSDIEFLVWLRRTTMSNYLQDMGLPTDSEAILTRVMLDYECAKIVVVDGISAGLFKVKYLDTLNQWYVVQIQIHPEYQNMKIGRRLIHDLLVKAKTTGDSVTLGVLKTNPAQNLYYRLGFKKVGETDVEYNLKFN